MLFNLEFRWILAIFCMMNGLAAIWIYYDAQRFYPQVSPTGWAFGCLLFSCLTLLFWWRVTGSCRSGLVFFLLLTVAIVVLGFNNEPIDRILHDQISSSIAWAQDNIKISKSI
jgi:hypothetical protein